MPNTIKVRIAVAVDPKGRWYASGWGGAGQKGIENMDHLLELTDYDTIGPGEIGYWLTAELPVPEQTEVPATAEPIS